MNRLGSESHPRSLTPPVRSNRMARSECRERLAAWSARTRRIDRARGGPPREGSRLRARPGLHDAVVETVLVEQLEVGADARREGRLATAEDHGDALTPRRRLRRP